MKPYWSISEACVWAATLDPDAVDAVNGRNPDGVHWLMPDTPPDAYSDHVMAWHGHLRGGRPSVWEAFGQLRQLCGDELLTMFGVARDVGDFEPIPATAWAGLAIYHDEARGGFVAEIPLDLGNPGARWWTRLRLRSADVQRIWPPQCGSERRFPAIAEVTAWYLTERVAKHDASHPSPSRGEDEKAARDYFRKAGFRTGEPLKELVRAVRTQEAPDWTVSGPKGRKIHAQAQRNNLA